MCSRAIELGIDILEKRGVTAGCIIVLLTNACRAGGGTETHSESFTSVPKTNHNNPRDINNYYFQEQQGKLKHGTSKEPVNDH